MAAELNITLDSRNLFRFRTLLAKASRTEAAKSLTFTAERARDAWRLENHRLFHMRRKWIDTGVRVKYATAGNLVARVGSIDEYMGRHVEGVDTPKGHTNAHGIFVPIKPIDQQGTHTQFRRQLAAMGRTKRKPFWMIGLGGNLLLARRDGKERTPITVLAAFRDHINLKPRMDALGIVDGAVQAAFPAVYERLLLKALDAG